MRRVPGGCAPNIAYGLALLGERPLLLASAGTRRRRIPGRPGGGGRRRLGPRPAPRRLHRVLLRFDRPRTRTRSPPSTRERWRARATSPIADAGAAAGRARDHFAERSGGDGAVHAGVPAARDPVPLRPEPAGGAADRRGAAGGHARAPRCSIVNDYELGIVSPEDGPVPRGRSRSSCPSSSRRTVPRARRSRSRGTGRPAATHGSRRRGSSARPSTRRASETPSAPASSGGCGWASPGRWRAGWAAWRPFSGSRRSGPQPPRYRIEEFIARYERNFGGEAVPRGARRGLVGASGPRSAPVPARATMPSLLREVDP